jgi:hypothetical protein
MIAPAFLTIIVAVGVCLAAIMSGAWLAWRNTRTAAREKCRRRWPPKLKFFGAVEATDCDHKGY